MLSISLYLINGMRIVLSCLISKECELFIVRNSSCGKVMFSQASVSHSVLSGGGGFMHGWGMRGGGMCGRVASMARRGGGGFAAWQERRPLQRTVRILLECILVRKYFWQLQTDANNVNLVSQTVN